MVRGSKPVSPAQVPAPCSASARVLHARAQARHAGSHTIVAGLAVPEPGPASVKKQSERGGAIPHRRRWECRGGRGGGIATTPLPWILPSPNSCMEGPAVAAFARPARSQARVNAPPCSAPLFCAPAPDSAAITAPGGTHSKKRTGGGEHGGRREGRGRRHACREERRAVHCCDAELQVTGFRQASSSPSDFVGPCLNRVF